MNDLKSARRKKVELRDPSKSDQLPPHCELTERATLGAVLLAGEDDARRAEVPSMLSKLNERDFYLIAHRDVFNALSSIAANGRRIDSVMLFQRLSATGKLDRIGGPAAIAELTGAATGAGAFDNYLAKLKELAARRTMIADALTAIEAARNESTPLTTALGVEGMQAWAEAVDGAGLLDELRVTINRFLVLPKSADALLAVWILATYVFQCFRFTPYLHVTSPEKECGKSTLAEMLAHLCHKATTPGGMTTAAMYRRIEARRPTLLLDEWDTLREENRQAALNVLNTGFKWNGVFTLCVGDDHEDRDFSTFCPKAIFGLSAAKLADTTQSRCFPLRLQKKLPSERVEKLTRKFDGATLRAKCLRWANDHRRVLSNAEPVMPEGLGARQEDISEPLLAVADASGGHWPKLIRECILHFFRVSERDNESSVGVELLKDLATFMQICPAGDSFSSREAVDWLNDMEARQWGGWNEGKGITQRQLCARLRPFGVQSGDVWIGGKALKGFHRAQFNEPFERYLPFNADSNRETARTLDNIEGNAVLTSARADDARGSENAVSANEIRHPRGLADKKQGNGPVDELKLKYPNLVAEVA